MAAEYMAVGMDGLIPKPIQFGQLLAAIDKAMSGEAAGDVAVRTAA